MGGGAEQMNGGVIGVGAGQVNGGAMGVGGEVKQRNGWRLVGVIAIVVALGLAGVGAFMFMQKGDAEKRLADVEKRLDARTSRAEDVVGSEIPDTSSGGLVDPEPVSDDSGRDPNVVTAAELEAVYDGVHAGRFGYTVGNTKMSSISAITNSSISPWQTVFASADVVDGGGHVQYFYRYGVDGEWILGYGAQDMPSCERFGVAWDAQEAFADTLCHNGGDVITIKSYYGLP